MGSEESTPQPVEAKDTSLDEWFQFFLINSEDIIVPLEETLLYLLNAPFLILICHIQAYDIYFEEMPQYADQMYTMCNEKWEESYQTLWMTPDEMLEEDKSLNNKRSLAPDSSYTVDSYDEFENLQETNYVDLNGGLSGRQGSTQSNGGGQSNIS